MCAPRTSWPGWGSGISLPAAPTAGPLGSCSVKTEFEYLRFVELPRKPERRTGNYSCQNRSSSQELGKVMWHGPWRQYCYFPTVQAVYSAGCLRDMAEFLEGLKAVGR
jgi:hypothetical protein